MAHSQVVFQLEENAGLYPPGVIPRNAQLNGEPVHRRKGRFQPLVHQ